VVPVDAEVADKLWATAAGNTSGHSRRDKSAADNSAEAAMLSAVNAETAEGTGLEPATGYPARHFQFGRGMSATVQPVVCVEKNRCRVYTIVRSCPPTWQ
jgi:hypothetical protein